jgi:hypothetical protein
MPTVAIIDGVKIQFYWDEHPPSHFHVEYGECRAQIALDGLQITRGTGRLPPGLRLEWLNFLTRGSNAGPISIPEGSDEKAAAYRFG